MVEVLTNVCLFNDGNNWRRLLNEISRISRDHSQRVIS